MLLASSIIGTVLHPIFVIAGYVLAFFYQLIPNYAVAIALLTVTVMIIVFPLTRMSARSMMRMQLLAPEMKKIQAKYKAKPGAPAAERQELRTKMNEEVMALYRENGVNPTGGCLPMFLQFPILIVLYDVVRGLSKTTTETVNGVKTVVATPQNIPHNSKMYHALIASGGQMHALGINLADSVRTPQAHWYDVIPYAVMVLIAIGLQYISIWQVTTRNPAATQANPQMQTMQKFMPLIFLVLYIALPAGVGVYFIVSSLFRIGQQEWMYKHDPQITKAIAELQQRKASAPPEPAGEKKGFLQSLREAANPNAAALGAGDPKPTAKPAAKSGTKPPAKKPATKPAAKKPPAKPGGSTAKSGTNGAAAKNGTGTGGASNGSGSSDDDAPAKPAANTRSKAKRPRRDR